MSGSNDKKDLLWGSQEWFYNLSELIPGVSIQGYTTDGTVIYWNKGSESIYGYTRDEAVGRYLGDLIIPEDVRPLFEQVLKIGKTLTQSGEFAPSSEFTLLHKDGHLVPVYTIHTAVCKDGSEPIMFCIDVDLTERKSTEQQLLRLNKTLEDQNRHLEKIIQIITHDLKTPMVNIQGFSAELEQSIQKLSHYLQSTGSSQDQQKEIQSLVTENIPEYLYFINKGVQKMDSLLKGVLKLARVGNVELSIQEIDMNQLFGELSRDLAYKTRGIDVDIEIDDLPNCRGDETQIHCVFNHLLDNAIKYLRADQKGCVCVRGESNPDGLVYCVQDNGIGIDPAYQKSICKPFYHVDSSEKDGDGLGLTIVETIILRHHGWLTFESEPGQGSTFCVHLPK